MVLGSAIRAPYGDAPFPSHPCEFIHFHQPDTEFMDQFAPNIRQEFTDSPLYADDTHIGYLMPSRSDARNAAYLARILLALNCSYFVEHLVTSDNLTVESKKVFIAGPGASNTFNLSFCLLRA